MSVLGALVMRELKAFWYSPMAYVVGALFLFLQGWIFWLLVVVLNDPRVDPATTISQLFFGNTIFFWLSNLLLAPLLTMRAFSEEKRTGTSEFLLTAPVSDMQVVLAKFLGAWAAYVMLWLCTLPFFLMLRTVTTFDWGPVWTGYLGVSLLGGALLSFGILTSSLTRNQVIAAVGSFVITMLLFSIGLLDFFIHEPEASKLIHHFSLIDHLSDFSRGVLDTRPLILYFSLTGLALFFTQRIISHPRWRS